jgi:hypothetical protein
LYQLSAMMKVEIRLNAPNSMKKTGMINRYAIIRQQREKSTHSCPEKLN